MFESQLSFICKMELHSLLCKGSIENQNMSKRFGHGKHVINGPSCWYRFCMSGWVLKPAASPANRTVPTRVQWGHV